MIRRAACLLALCVAFAVLHTWPLASNPGGLSRLDNADTALNTWIVAWVAHIVPRHPLQVFEAPIFYPERHTLAYSEHMLVPSLMGAPLLWLGASPVLVYNLLVLLGLALSAWTMTLVVSRWTGSTWAGLTSGLLFAFNAHLLTRFVHLQALHVQFLPIVLYAFDALLTTAAARPRVVKATAVLTTTFVLQALCSNYTLVFLASAPVVAALVRWREWLWPVRPAIVVALLAGAFVSAAMLLPFLWPYYQLSREQGLVRSIDEVRLYSAGWLDYLTTGGRLHYAWWSHRVFDGRTALFPGVAGCVLTAIALCARDIRRQPRAQMMMAIGIAGAALSFGPALPGYAWLHAHVPLLSGIRGAARWGFLLLVAIAVMSGYGVAVLQRRWGHTAVWPAVMLAILGVVTIEALRTPMSFVPYQGMPAIYARLPRTAGVVLAEIPLYAGNNISRNAPYVLANTQTVQPLVNGYSGFASAAWQQRAQRWRHFPDAGVLSEMRATGVTHVTVHEAAVDPVCWSR